MKNNKNSSTSPESDNETEDIDLLDDLKHH